MILFLILIYLFDCAGFFLLPSELNEQTQFSAHGNFSCNGTCALS